MKKFVKLLITGAIAGGVGYVLLNDQRKKKLAMTAQDVREDIQRTVALGKEILPVGLLDGVDMDKREYVQTVVDLFKELPNMSSDEDIETVRFRLERLAKADRRWSVLSSIFNEGTSASDEELRAKRLAEGFAAEELAYQANN